MTSRQTTQTEALVPATASFTSMRSGILQRKCGCGNHTFSGGKCAECAKKKNALQRTASNQSQITEVPPIVYEVLNSRGQPLDPESRAFMEPRFEHNFSHVPVRAGTSLSRQSPISIGHPDDPLEHEADAMAERIVQSSNGRAHNRYDFGDVRVHSDTKAAESARAINARAYAVGRDIVFAARQYTPNTRDGRQLLAHELTHVLQQSGPNLLRRKPPSSQSQTSQQEAATNDLIKAETYLTDYYDNEDKIINDIYLHSINAVHKFGIYSRVKATEGEEPPIKLIKTVLNSIPDAGPILEAIELLEKMLPVAKEAVGVGEKAGVISKPQEKADVAEATAESLSKTIAPYTRQREALSQGRKRDRDYLEALHVDIKN